MKPKQIISRILHNKAKRLLAKNNPRIVAVVGSAGKTSTKNMIGQVLSKYRKVRYTREGYNSDLGLPLSVFDIKHPDNLKNVCAWVVIFIRCDMQILFGKRFDIFVSEIGIQDPGEIDGYLDFIKPEVVVLTTISPEHMEMLGDMDTVAQEELKAVVAAEQAFVNRDDVSGAYIEKYATGQENIEYFGMDDYGAITQTVSGAAVDIETEKVVIKDIKTPFVSDNYLKSMMAAVSVADYMGYSEDQIKKSLRKLRPTPGRMNVLEGVNGSTIIDDSYNSSPLAVVSALRTLLSLDVNRRIAVLGNMNEMGDYVPQAYRESVEGIDMNQVDYVFTIGDQSAEHYGALLQEQGFDEKNFRGFSNAIEAGEYLQKFVTNGDVVLVKGSQGNVFSEETVKLILDNPKRDSKKLVRQSKFWMKEKGYLWK